jgi:Protein of unknown function (DUF3747)
MRLSCLRPLISCFLTVTYLMGYSSAVRGVGFEQQEIEQNQLIAIARPYGDHQYDLLIVLQIPGKQQCWNESGTNPVIVDPLLLNFDFSGSCERSTDSNGYSIRIDGQDYGLDYLLRVVRRNDELLLVGTERSRRSGRSDVIVGRTHGVAPGLLKFSLDPGWRFTKRVYQGKVLSHVYLTGDSKAMKPMEATQTASNPTAQPSSPSGSSRPPKELTFIAEGTKPQPPTPPLPQNKPPTEALAPLPPTSPLPQNKPPTEALAPLPAPPETVERQPLPPPLPSVSSTPERSSSRKNLSDTLADLSGTPSNRLPPPPVTQTPVQGRYRVIVGASNNDQKSQVRSLYPDAFATSHNGRSVMQIGVFSTQDKAQQALQGLTDIGLKGQIVPF